MSITYTANHWHSVWPSIAKKYPNQKSMIHIQNIYALPGHKTQNWNIFHLWNKSFPNNQRFTRCFKGSVALCLPDRSFCRQLMPSWGTGTEQRLSPHLVESIPAQRTVEPSWWFYHVFKGGSSVFQSRIRLGTTRCSDLYISIYDYAKTFWYSWFFGDDSCAPGAFPTFAHSDL